MQSKKGRKKKLGLVSTFKQNDDDDDCGGARRSGCFWSSAPPLDSYVILSRTHRLTFLRDKCID